MACTFQVAERGKVRQVQREIDFKELAHEGPRKAEIYKTGQLGVQVTTGVVGLTLRISWESTSFFS